MPARCMNPCSQAPPGLGDQRESQRSTGPRAVFGTCTRDGWSKVMSRAPLAAGGAMPRIAWCNAARPDLQREHGVGVGAYYKCRCDGDGRDIRKNLVRRCGACPLPRLGLHPAPVHQSSAFHAPLAPCAQVYMDGALMKAYYGAWPVGGRMSLPGAWVHAATTQLPAPQAAHPPVLDLLTALLRPRVHQL